MFSGASPPNPQNVIFSHLNPFCPLAKCTNLAALDCIVLLNVQILWGQVGGAEPSEETFENT